MDYKRIVEIKNENAVVAADIECMRMAVVFRPVRTGEPSTFVIEGDEAKRKKIDKLVAELEVF